MTEPERILKSGKNDAASLLLQSAVADNAPDGAKKRAYEALGLGPMGAKDTASTQRTNISAKRVSLIASIANSDSSPKRAPKEALRLFRSVLDEPSLVHAIGERGRLGLGFIVTLQAAAVVLLLLVRPMRMPDPQPPVLAARPGMDVDTMQPPAHSEEPRIGVSVGDVVSAADNTPPSAAPAVEAPRASIPFAEPAKTMVVPLEWITRPKRIEGRDPHYTREAREARVEGTAVVQCEVTKAGLTRDCKITKSLPHMEEELLSAASTWRFTPAMADGQPMTTLTSFTVTLVLPKI